MELRPRKKPLSKFNKTHGQNGQLKCSNSEVHWAFSAQFKWGHLIVALRFPFALIALGKDGSGQDYLQNTPWGLIRKMKIQQENIFLAKKLTF